LTTLSKTEYGRRRFFFRFSDTYA